MTFWSLRQQSFFFFYVLATQFEGLFFFTHHSTKELTKGSDLRLHLQHPLPRLSQLRLGLGFAQPHAHQLVLQLTQRVLPGAVLPAASSAS